MAPPGAAGQGWGVEEAGDVVMRTMPVATLAGTLVEEDFDGSLQFLGGFAVNGAVTEGLKRLISKDRPDASDDKSFPSGHTSVAFQSASFLHLRYGFRYGAPAYALAAFVGYSRVHARKHFLEDAAVGAAIGFLSSRLLTDRRRDEDPQANALALGMRLDFGSGLARRFSWGILGAGG